MSDDKPIDAAAVEAAVNQAIRRGAQWITATSAIVVRGLVWCIEPALLAVFYFMVASFIAPNWFAIAPAYFLVTLTGAAFATSLIRRSVDWPSLGVKLTDKKLAVASSLNAKVRAPLAAWSAPLRQHKTTRWTVAILAFLATRLVICLKWVGFIFVLLLKFVATLIEALFEAFGNLLKGIGVFLGGLLIFAIWALVLLGIIGILVFGIGQIF